MRHGTWPSPVTVERVTGGAARLSDIVAHEGYLFWSEGRPTERGRQVVVRCTPDGSTRDAIPREFNARTRVHEYGGRSFALVGGDAIVFANFDDQRLYRIDAIDTEPVPITPEPETPAGLRYADFAVTPDHQYIVCIREAHREHRVDNELVVIPLAGHGEPRTVASGRDHMTAPRLSPDGRQLAWLAWDHPSMPWDDAELWVAPVDENLELGPARRVAGGDGESAIQPAWDGQGRLHFLSDRTGWWNLYRLEESGSLTALAPKDAEFGEPPWLVGAKSYDFFADGRIVCRAGTDNVHQLSILHVDGLLEALPTPLTAIDYPTVWGDDIALLGASSELEQTVLLIRTSSPASPTTLRAGRSWQLDQAYISRGQAITFPTTFGEEAHAFCYSPHNPDVEPPSEELPPLIVFCHGGPTGGMTASLNVGIQFWTTRGFAVVDVNYRGSTGYGRHFRNLLRGRWGIVDVDDCVHAAQHLVALGMANPDQLFIRGGSAGGWTTICALAFRDVFAGGTSVCGVADMSQIMRDTHKFESRYFDRLIAPWPEGQAVYDERSPLRAAGNISAPLLILQGLEDKIVPPNQAEMIVAALDRNQVMHGYLAFEGEGHGFRKAENQQLALSAELYFYQHILGVAAPSTPPLTIAHA